MRRAEALRIIREHEAELRAMGVESVELFGSVARDEAGPDSDVDVLVRFDERERPKGLAFFRRYVDVEELFSVMLDERVELATHPLTKSRFEKEIERDRVTAY